MKKRAITFASILCLVLIVFALASCSNGKKPARTDGTAPVTTAATTAGDAEHVHVWDTEYTVDAPATCTEDGARSIYCSTCRELKPGSTEIIPALGHTPPAEGDYTVDSPASCTKTGSKSYHCTVCHEIIEGTDVVIPVLDHDWATDYTVDQDATCSAPGSKSIHCKACNAVKDGSATPIPSDPDKHVVEDWTTEVIPTLLAQEGGYRDGECSLCHAPVHEDLTWKPVVFDSKNPSGDYYDAATGNFSVRKTFGSIRGEKHFYPTESEPYGNDLWFEYSLLWNETLANTLNARISVAEITGYDEPDACELFGLNTRDVAANEEFAGRFCFNRTYVYGSGAVDKKAGTTWSSRLEPASDCVLEVGGGQPRYLGRFDETVTADSYAPIGNYGWHRIGFHFYMVSDPSDTDHAKALAEPGQKGSYYAYTELYVDGVKVWKVQQSITGYWDGNAWQNRSFALRPNDAVPFILTASETVATTKSAFKDKATEYDGIWYVDNDKRSVGMSFYGIAGSENSVYVVIDDPQWTCGEGFVREVEPVASPVAKNITLAEGVEVPGTVFFQLKP